MLTDLQKKAREQLGGQWRRRLETALGTLADGEGVIRDDAGIRNDAHGLVCESLRTILDDE